MPNDAIPDPDSSLPLLFSCITASKLLMLTLHPDLYTKILHFFCCYKILCPFCQYEKAQSILYGGWRKGFFTCLPYTSFMVSIHFLQPKEKKRFWCSCAFHITFVVLGADRDMMACLIVQNKRSGLVCAGSGRPEVYYNISANWLLFPCYLKVQW